MSRLSYQTSRALTTSQLDQVFQMFLPSPPVLLLCHWWPRSTAELRYKPRNTIAFEFVNFCHRAASTQPTLQIQHWVQFE